ncbi:adhesin [Herbaspirillum huttiense]|uniref:adhesin n=1 Tax=Herbaspirillum huttiense TaxID=863372 RepID=UPI003CF90065
MSITVLNLTEASALLRTINKRDIKDVRAIDLDLALVLESGHKIIISRGAVAAVNSPQLMLEFADGDVALGDVFEKLNHIEVPADAAVTVTSKEITRYGIKRVVKPKVARNKQDQEADKDKTDEETAASPDTEEARPAEALAGNDGSGGSRSGDSGGSNITASKFTSGKGSSSSLAIQDVADAPADIGSSKGGISWPVIAGGLGLLAAAGGGGGGGGGGGAAAPGAGSGTGAGIAATLSGAAALGPLNNATITAYDAEGRVIGKAVPVINGRYTLVLDQSGYKGLILLAIRDNTPGVADNYADEASVRMTDLGNTVLRAVALADGSNQVINVTALTELAALKAGLGTGQTNLAAAQVGATTVTGANAAVSNLFKVDILSGDVAPVTTTDAQGAAVINPAFLQSASVTARNYGIALKAIANLVQTNKERYTDNGEAIRKLADALQFTDGLQSRLKWKDGTTQSDLFGESLNARANDPARSQSERDQARTLYDQLQKLPNGSSINDFLLDNHIALSDPAILIKNTTPGGPPWQAPANSGTVILDQEALGNGGLAVRAPPQSKVEVTFVGHDAQGKEVRVKLPVSTADSSGIAVLRPNEAAIELLKQMTREQPVTAQVAVSDGDNSRSANNLWQGNADVRIDIKTPPGLTDFASNKIMLANDSFYTGGEGNDPLRTTPQGNDDLLTSDASVRVVLGNAIKSSERLQFAVATAKSADGQPIYGNWIDPVGLVVESVDSGGQVHYLARNLVSKDGPVWVKARVVQIGAQFTNGFGGSRELDTPLQFTLDKTAPVKVQLVMAENRDDGVSNSDGISSQSQVTLNPVAAFETGAEVHLRLATAVGTSNSTLQVVHADDTRTNVEPGTWIQWKAGDRLQLIGESRTFNGKARLEVRQIDQAGNYTDSIQTFIADRSQVIEQMVPLANREKAVIEAKAAVVAAVQAADLATGADKAAKQTALATARTALQTAQAGREQALEEARIALTKSDGSTRLADLIGKPVDAAYLPAILRAVAATADPDKVNEARGLTDLVDSTIVAANQALDKAKVYGDNDSNPAPTSADFEHMGMAGTDQQGTLTLANAALKTLPAASSNSIAAIRDIVQAAARVAALADGTAGNTTDANLPDAATYATLGVATALTPAAARVLGQVIDGKALHEVATTAMIESLATAALRVTQFAAGTNLASPLTAQDFSTLGISGVTADNVARLAGQLRAVPQSLIDSGKVSGVVDTLDHAPAAPSRPLPADLIALGLPPGEVASVPAANMTLLIDAITARSFSNLGVDHTGTALALPAKLSHLLGVIASVRNSAATGLASTDLSAAHLQELGLSLTAYNNAAGTPGHHLPAILSAIAASGSEAGSLAALQTLASRAASAQDKILHYADETGSPTAPAPTAEDYRAIGLARLETDATGARIALVSPERVAAINAALHASGIGPDRADTPAGIKRVVTAYNAILDSANGTAGDTAVALTGEHYRDIGVTIAGVTAPGGGGKDGAILSLFNSLIDSLSAADVATPAKIEALGATVGKLIGLAGQPRTQPVSNAPASGELARFGIQSLSDDERDAFIAVLQTKAVSDFDTLGEVQALATSVRAAYARVIAYAETNGGAAPTVADYQALAITGISDNAGHRDAVNAALATTAVKGSTVARLNALQAVVDSYRLLLQQADGTADNTATADLAKLEHFENIGVDMMLLKQLDGSAAGATRNAVQLLSSLVDSRSTAAVDTPQELQQLVSLVHKLALAEQGLDTSPLLPADFALIGMPVSDAAVVAQIRAQLALLPDDGSGLNTWNQLRTLLLSVTGVPTWDVVAGDDIINLAERTAGVTLSGSAGQNDVLTLFYPDGSVMKSGITPHDAGGGKFTWSYMLTAEDWTKLGANSADGVVRTLQLQARNTSTNVDSIKVAHQVTIDTVAPPASLVLTLEQDTGVSATDGITSNGKVKVSGMAAGAQWEYRIGSTGEYQAGMGDSFTVTAQGAQTASVRQFDQAGNRSAAQTLDLNLDTQAPGAPVIALDSVGGTVNDLPVTNNDTVKVSGLEPGARLQWRLNRNDYADNPAWTDASGTTINPIGLAPSQVRNVYLEVRQLDVAGNAGSVSRLGFTLDTSPPAAPGLSLVGARGDAASGLFSNSGMIDIAGLEPLGRWEYSVNGGSSFVAGSGSRLTLPAGDGAKTVIVRQYDLAGNHTDSLPLAFTLDTGRPPAPTPVLRLDSGALANDGITTDGTVRIDNLESGATWEYSLDNGTTWSMTGITGNTVSFTDNGTRRSLQVRQTDRAGNVSDPSAKLEFTVDTTPPRTPRLALVNNSSGDEATHLSNDGRIDVLDLDAGASWQFSTDDGTSWTNGSGNRFTVSGDGPKRLLVRQTDAAGNTSTSSVLSMELDTTAPAKPGLPSLVADSGRDGTDRITSDSRLQTPVASEAGLRFEYSFDGIAWSSFNQPIRGARDGGSDGLKKLKVSSIDRAGNRSAPSDEFSFTLDTVAPAKLVPTLLKPVSGGSTTDGTVLIGAQEAGSVWEYSLDRGTTWQVGTGDRIKVKGRDESGTDGVKSVQLRQTDAAGNSSVSEVLEFNLLTKLDAPGLSVVTPVRILPDRTVLLDVGDSSVLPLGSKMVLEVSGRAGMTAIVTRDDGLEVGRLVLNAEGKGRLEVGRTLTLSGLKTVSGANTTANAVYELVQSGDTIFRLRNTSPAYFGAEFSENGVPLVDMSKPVYRTGPADSDWYVWSAQGGGYIISRRGDSGEWYREAPSSQPAQTPEAVKNWVAVNRSASLVAEEQLHNSGASSHQRTLEGVGVVNSNGWRETPWTYKAIQQSSPDNRSEPTEVKVRMFTTTPSALDLDAATSGVQGNLVLPATRSELLGGLSLFASPAAPAGNATRSIELVFNNKSPAGNQLISNNDLLVLDGTEVRMNAAHAKVGNLTVGGVGDVSYETVVNEDRTTTLTISKTSGGAFTGAEIRSVLSAIKLRNSLDLATGFDQRTIDVKLIDDTGRRSFDNARVTVQVEGYGLQVDLNDTVAGIQRTSKRYLNSEFVSTGGLTEGTPFVRTVAAPTGTPETIKLNFTGVDPINEMIYSTDAKSELRSGGQVVYFGSIAGVYGLFWWSPHNGEVQIRKSSTANFTGEEVKRIVEGVRMVTTTRNDIERSMEITLVGPGSALGATSRATLVVDTRAPDLDLDASQAGNQATVNTIVPRNQTSDGVKLFKGEVTAPVVGDTAKVVLTLPVPAGTSPAGSEKIVLSTDKRFPTTTDFNITGSIGGVDGLAIRYTAATRELSISRQDGASLPGSQVKAILEGLKYSFPPNPDLSSGLNNEHRFEISLVDQAGNTSKGRVEMSTLRTTPASLAVSVVDGQFGYGLIKMSNVFGSSTAPLSFPAVLTKNEQAIPTLPAGFTAASLLQAIRGISAEWGGKGVSGDGNTSIGSLKSYQMFDKLGTGTTSFSLLQQGSSLDTLGAWLRLGLKPAATAGLNNVALEMLGGFKRNGVDQYKLSPDLETGLSDVGLANIGLLYQLSVANTSSRPVIRVRFDSSNNVAGNVIELYEGGRLVGSKTLVASDLGGGPKEVDVAVFQSLSAGKHDLEVRYTDTGGNSVNSNLSVNVAAGGAPVTLSDLGVRGSKQSASEAQSLGQSGASYAVISDADTSFASGHGNQGPVFVGTVGGGSASDRYLVTIQMGGKVVAFEDVGAGSFAIGIPAGVLPPGYYQDLSISATVLTPGARLGQTTSMQGLKLGWYWAAQAGTSIVGGNGNDELVLGAAADPEIVGGIRVQTGAGDDRITVGSFGKTSGLKATVTDFTVGMDRVKVFGQIVNPDFVKNYVTASDLNGSTQLQIDLDGAGAGKLYYHLTLQGVQYNPSTIGSIFGV